jgi:hypothetical protein
MPLDQDLRDHCERVLPERVCREVEKVVRDKGFEFNKDPKTVVLPEPVIRDGKIVGGAITIRMEWPK